MFTGLVEATGKITEIKALSDEMTEITVEKPKFFNDLKKGHSVAHDGVCLTIKNEDPVASKVLSYDIGKETLKVTKFESLKVGDLLNLERPLAMGDRLHGHLVTGHVDEVCELLKSVDTGGGCLELFFTKCTKPEYIWSKGSIVINGVSLTINDVYDGGFTVCLIPETLEKTNLSGLQAGDKINIEYDFWAKGVIHANRVRSKQES